MMDKPLTPLAEAFEFTHDDLHANRERRLTWRQRRRLWLRWWAVLLGGLLLVCAPIWITWGMVSWSKEQPLIESIYLNESLVGYLVGILLGLAYGAANIKSLLLVFDLLLGRVHMIRGIANVYGRYMSIGRRRFLIDENALELVVPGLRYRVFLLPASSTLLSIEFAD